MPLSGLSLRIVCTDFLLKDQVKSCTAGKRSGKEWLYKQFYGYLMGVTLRYVGSREIAEELVNDSFMKIFFNIGGFVFPQEKGRCVQAFKAWIARIASRTALDYLRKPSYRTAEEDVSEFSFLGSEENILSSINAREILLLLYDLPEVQRLIFSLHEIEGYRHEEIAEHLGIEEKVSRVYLSRARRKLRLLYQKKIQNKI